MKMKVTERNKEMDTVERFNTIALDSTFALIDGMHQAQSQALQLGETWIKAVAESQNLAGELSKTLLNQSIEAQSAWRRYAKESAPDLNGHFSSPLEPKASPKSAAAK